MEVKDDFLKNTPTCKKIRFFLCNDLERSHMAHMQEKMPHIRATREEGKIAFYGDKRVVIFE